MSQSALKILQEDEELNPILSVVNLIDVFLVIIVALMLLIAQNPVNPLASTDDVVVVKNPGTPKMEMIVKKGKEIQKYETSKEVGQGEGILAGTAYRLKDGSFIYVPQSEGAKP